MTGTERPRGGLEGKLPRREFVARIASWALGGASVLLGLMPALRAVFDAARLPSVTGPAGFLPLAPLAELQEGCAP